MSSDDASAPPEWYADGLRFSCSQCGNCCTGPPGAVWFTPEEGTAMAKHLGLDERTFYRRYSRRANGEFSLTEQKTEHGYDCVFLERDARTGKAGCGLYGARPSQCRTWPFWRENLVSPEAWASAKLQTPCPGMDQGRLVRIDQIRIQRDDAAS